MGTKQTKTGVSGKLTKLASVAAAGIATCIAGTAFAANPPVGRAPAQSPDVKINKDAAMLDRNVIPFFGAAFHGNAQMWPEQKYGLYVVYIKKDSPADRAGLKPGDVLLTFDDQRLFFPNQFSALMRMCRPGDNVKITFLRDGEIFESVATLQVRGGQAVERGNKFAAVPVLPDSDDVRIIVNGKEFPISGNSELRNRISVSPEKITIRMSNELPEEVRTVLERFRERVQVPMHVEEGLKIEMQQAHDEQSDETYAFSQTFFGNGNSVTISGRQGEREVVVRTSSAGEIFRGPCATQEEIDAIPEDAREIIDDFTALTPIAETPAESAAAGNSDEDETAGEKK
ncbi:MAG: PDZ domain-containing protein [Opitutae bacterium]|nr:PDZ domain-containing protein [Opitutae bacterium]